MVAAEMRLIHKGKILKDEQNISEYKITDGLTVHLVKGKSAAPSGGAGGSASTEALNIVKIRKLTTKINWTFDSFLSLNNSVILLTSTARILIVATLKK